jgi:hypothetical protein
MTRQHQVDRQERHNKTSRVNVINNVARLY